MEQPFSLNLPCKYLRSKEMYYQTGYEEEAFSSDAFWCTKTHQSYGPDKNPVGKSECAQGRTCFCN
ncbi:MAG: hypothetical protein AMXMBFR84_22730 [Candidatus Hydrogenedentota bacterium]